MADNVSVNGVLVAADETPYSGDTTDVQIVQLAFVTGAEGSRTLAKVPGNGTDGLIASVGDRPSTTATSSAVGDSATSVTLLAANASRLSVVVHNDSLATLYLKYDSAASGASVTNYTYKLAPDQQWDMSYLYRGLISGIWSSDAGGNARVTELT